VFNKVHSHQKQIRKRTQNLLAVANRENLLCTPLSLSTCDLSCSQYFFEKLIITWTIMASDSVIHSMAGAAGGIVAMGAT
jgi:hypothetical protein